VIANRRGCPQDLNEVIAAFVQDKTTIERGLFDSQLAPEELPQLRMGKIIKDKYPVLDKEDQEAVRQHAVAALNLTQKAEEVALVAMTRGTPWPQCRGKNVPAASETRPGSEWLLHGPGSIRA
jgi:hypothetical protein